MDAPYFTTTIDQHVGIHEPTGLMETRLKEVRTAYSDYADDPWESLTDEDKQWWNDVLEDIHAATVDLEEVEPDLRQKIKDGLQAFDGDLEDFADWLRDEIAERLLAS